MEAGTNLINLITAGEVDGRQLWTHRRWLFEVGAKIWRPVGIFSWRSEAKTTDIKKNNTKHQPSHVRVYSTVEEVVLCRLFCTFK